MTTYIGCPRCCGDGEEPGRPVSLDGIALAQDACRAAIKSAKDAYYAAIRPALDAYYAAIAPHALKALLED